MLTTGIGRRKQHHVRGRDRVGDPWSRGGLVRSDEREAVRRHLRPVAHPPLLEVDRPALAGVGIGDDDVGFAAVIAGGQQVRAGRPALAQRLGHLRERIAGPQHLAADEMRGQIAVAEPEPVGLHSIGGEFLLGMPGFVAVAPPALGVDAAAEGVHAGVEVGADANAVHPRVVADVDDRRSRMILWFPACELAEAEQVLDPQQESRTADSADQNGDLHTDRH